jgi:tRNA threonylcarbamoyl adenosine modification protein (Sua5/YciO/YrdC/YwlC family)
MAQYFQIHPANPQGRLIRQAAAIVHGGGVIVYPTDTTYAFGARIGDKSAVDRICRIRQIDDRHHFTIACRDLSELGTYAFVSTPAFRLLKAHTPGPYTFILEARPEVPRRLLHPRKKTIGLRVPDHTIAQALLAELGEPMLTTTMRLPDDDLPLNDPHDIRARLQHLVDLVIDGGPCGFEGTTVVELGADGFTLVRQGKGPTAAFS